MNSAELDLQIRPFASTDSIEELTALLHRAYKQLADMGLKFLATHQDVDTTRNRVNAGDCFVAELDGRVIGTITFYMPGKPYGSPWLERADVGHIGQLAVEPDYQLRRVATRLMQF
jgi:GNAT superfamily N-acetyltransferase